MTCTVGKGLTLPTALATRAAALPVTAPEVTRADPEPAGQDAPGNAPAAARFTAGGARECRRAWSQRHGAGGSPVRRASPGPAGTSLPATELAAA